MCEFCIQYSKDSETILGGLEGGPQQWATGRLMIPWLYSSDHNY